MQHQQNHSMSSRPRSSSKHGGGRGGSPRAPSGSSIQPPSNVPTLAMMQQQPQPRIPQHCQQQQQQVGPLSMHHFPPRASQSFQSFQRQESTGSFYSSHSAPTNCGVHKHHHGHGHHAHGQGHHHHHHHGPPLRGHPPQNLESCSTQSSSSSASGPPDYATCAGAPPPAYDHNTSSSMKTTAGVVGVRGMIKGHPPNPPPRSDNPIIVQAPKIPPHQGSGSGSGGSSSASRRKTSRGGAGAGDHPGGSSSHSRSNSAIRQQPQQQQPQQPQHHPHHRHHNFAMNKSRQAGSNELYYMGEFYG